MRVWCAATSAATFRPFSVNRTVRLAGAISIHLERLVLLPPDRPVDRLRGQRQLGQAHADGIFDRVGDRRRPAERAGLAHTLGAERAVVLLGGASPLFHPGQVAVSTSISAPVPAVIQCGVASGVSPVSWSGEVYFGTKLPVPTMLPACMPYFFLNSSVTGTLVPGGRPSSAASAWILALTSSAARRTAFPLWYSPREPSVPLS